MYVHNATKQEAKATGRKGRTNANNNGRGKKSRESAGGIDSATIGG
jgi:hypothetical protein